MSKPKFVAASAPLQSPTPELRKAFASAPPLTSAERDDLDALSVRLVMLGNIDIAIPEGVFPPDDLKLLQDLVQSAFYLLRGWIGLRAAEEALRAPERATDSLILAHTPLGVH